MRLFTLQIALYISVSAFAFNDDSVREGLNLHKTVPILEQSCATIDSTGGFDTLTFATLGESLLRNNSLGIVKYNAYGYYATAQCDYLNGRFIKSHQYFDSALILFNKIADSNKICKIHNQLGNINYLIGNDNKAFLHYKDAFVIATLLNRDTLKANLLNNLGLVSTHQKDYKKSDYYNSRALEVYKKIKDEKSIADIYSNMGMSYAYRGDTGELGPDFLKKSIKIFEKLKDVKGKATALYFLGQIFENKKDYLKSDEYYVQSKLLYESIHDSINILSTLEKMAQISMRQKEYTKANKLLNECYLMNKTIGSSDYSELIYKDLYQTNKNLYDYKKALEYLEKYQAIRDSVKMDEENRKLSTLRQEFDEDLKLKEIERLRETSHQKNIILITLTILLGAIVLIMLSYWRNQSTRVKQKMLLLEQKVLRTQMDPHFLFNTMSAIQFFILDGKTEDAIKFLGDFSSLLRLVLQYSKDETIPIEKEQKIIEFYLQLQNKRFPRRITFMLIIDPELLDANILIPPMLAQPFIESFLENNRFEDTKDGQITIHYKLAAKNIELTISDNGMVDNRTADASQLRHQYAITTTKERIFLINSLRTGKVSVMITTNTISEGRGTKATFTIPINYGCEQIEC